VATAVVPGHIYVVAEDARLLLSVDLVLAFVDRGPWCVALEPGLTAAPGAAHVRQESSTLWAIAAAARGQSLAKYPTRTRRRTAAFMVERL